MKSMRDSKPFVRCHSFHRDYIREFDIRECYSIFASSGQLVTVIPRSDAESSDDSLMFLMLFVLDSASERGMTVTNRLFEIQNHIN